MARKLPALKGPSRLSTILQQLDSPPKLKLLRLKSLKLKYSPNYDHFGARRFVKDELPKIQWANPNVGIEIERKRWSKEDPWRPEIRLTYDNGNEQVVDMGMKRSSAILKELMDAAGDSEWKRWHADSVAQGHASVTSPRARPATIRSAQTDELRRPALLPAPKVTTKLSELYAQIADLPVLDNKGEDSSSREPKSGVSTALP
ncbi:hypothetical protein PLICRDRAFT_101265 [Plicaturopsis crispa FD-325 SS-3]|nr:hypothetical protein PLICRDRAFT_101265 [Plicaturopsis crispa FD-325 SS-3]